MTANEEIPQTQTEKDESIENAKYITYIGGPKNAKRVLDRDQVTEELDTGIYKRIDLEFAGPGILPFIKPVFGWFDVISTEL